MQDFNYHTHTYRCNHAVGTEDDYIKSAIENGYKILGFSEHCAYNNWIHSTGRLQMNNIDSYYKDITKAKEKYKDQIKIYTGLEFEFFPDLINYFRELKDQYDYLIVGQHSIDRSGRDMDIVATDEDVKIYAKYICKAIENNLADYVAHPDYFMLGRDDFNDICKDALKEICQCAKAYNIPVELNVKGTTFGMKNYQGYSSYIYPHTKAWEVIATVNPPVIIGYDAHDPALLSRRDIEKQLREFAKKYNLPEPFEKYDILNK